MSEVKTPWAAHMGDVPMHLEYFGGSMFQALEQVARAYPGSVAFDFMGKSTTYKKMIQEIERCAKSLKVLGIRAGDKVTIAMPNCPQAIYMFYAVNLVGGIANMIHPLSAEKEIEFYLNESQSITAITLDQFYNKFEHIRQNTGIVNIIIASVKDALSQPVRAGYMLTEGRKIQKIPEDAPVIRWKEFMDLSRHCFYKNFRVDRKADDPAVILYSGGTTGTTKGIVLTNGNFNALAKQIIATIHIPCLLVPVFFLIETHEIEGCKKTAVAPTTSRPCRYIACYGMTACCEIPIFFVGQNYFFVIGSSPHMFVICFRCSLIVQVIIARRFNSGNGCLGCFSSFIPAFFTIVSISYQVIIST